jgi:DNA-binding transcriptional MerR regulator
MSASTNDGSGGPDTGARPGRDLIKIGEFAKLAGTNLRTLRYYEEIGLLQPAARSSGGFRYYRVEDLDRLRMVASLQNLGLELARIRTLMDTHTEGTRQEFITRTRAALQEQVALIEKRVSALDQQRSGLDDALRKLEDCSHCEHRPSPENGFCHPCQVDGKALPPDLSALF